MVCTPPPGLHLHLSVTSGALQGSVLRPLLFNIFINDLEEVKEGTPNRFTDDTKVGWCKPAGALKGRSAIQSDLGRLEK